MVPPGCERCPRVWQARSVLADGSYDVIVVDTEERPDGRVACDLTVLAGDHKGDVVTVLAPLDSDPPDLLGVPATLVVAGGEPQLTFEP